MIAGFRSSCSWQRAPQLSRFRGSRVRGQEPFSHGPSPNRRIWGREALRRIRFPTSRNTAKITVQIGAAICDRHPSGSQMSYQQSGKNVVDNIMRSNEIDLLEPWQWRKQIDSIIRKPTMLTKRTSTILRPSVSSERCPSPCVQARTRSRRIGGRSARLDESSNMRRLE